MRIINGILRSPDGKAVVYYDYVPLEELEHIEEVKGASSEEVTMYCLTPVAREELIAHDVPMSVAGRLHFDPNKIIGDVYAFFDRVNERFISAMLSASIKLDSGLMGSEATAQARVEHLSRELDILDIKRHALVTEVRRRTFMYAIAWWSAPQTRETYGEAADIVCARLERCAEGEI